MTDDQKAAVINARAATAMIRAMGMHAENMQRQHRGEVMAYTSDDFMKIIEEEGTHWNAVAGVLFDH